MAGLRAPEVDYFVLRGGLDEVSPSLAIKPGVAIFASNYESDTYGGYSRIGGYERFDGRPSPHKQTYYIIEATITGTVTVGATLTGLTSLATGVVLAVESDGIVIGKLTGAFQTAESLQILGVTVATSISIAVNGSAATSKLDGTYKNLVADLYRTDIQAVPGSGSVRGVFQFNDVTYAFRNNAGGTACVMHKSTVSGWSAVALGEEVSFSNANTSVGDGDTLTQGGVTATISRVVVETGTLVSGVNTGRLILTGRAGGNYAAGAAVSTGGGSLTVSGVQTAITLLPGGRFEVIEYNFGGATSTKRIYGCDGVNRGFEFDGTTFVPIKTGMISDAPKFIAAHKNHLFFSFGSSLQHSAIANPYSWTPISGAGEISAGDGITGLKSLPGDANSSALLVTTLSKAFAMYGTSSANWNLVTAQNDSGARPYSVQTVGQVFMADDRGLMRFGQSQSFGNFEQATLSQAVRPRYKAMLDTITASSTSSERNQYRIFSSTGQALYMTLSGAENAGIMPVEFPDPVLCIYASEDNSGVERIFFGSSDGFVYELDVGTSFDGEPIEAMLTLSFTSSKSPRLRKRYRRGAIEARSDGGFVEISIGNSIAYDSVDVGDTGLQGVSGTFGVARWDASFFDDFFWDARGLQPLEFDLTGSGENISIYIHSNSDEMLPYTLSGIFIHFLFGRQVRG